MALENWSKCFDKGRGYCTYCGDDLLISISSFWSAQRDHVLARAANGCDEAENLVICCPSCNQALSQAKHLRTVEERRAFIQHLHETRKPTYEKWVKDLRGDG